jgi:hypothetical protein
MDAACCAPGCWSGAGQRAADGGVACGAGIQVGGSDLVRSVTHLDALVEMPHVQLQARADLLSGQCVLSSAVML